MSNPERRHAPSALTLLFLAATLGACSHEGPPAVRGGVAVAGTVSNAHCPYHSRIRLEVDQKVTEYDTLPLVGEITTIPEFHDCQRFIDSTGTGYGPLVGIFAVWSLVNFKLTPATPEPGLDFRERPVDEEAARVPAIARAPVTPPLPAPAGVTVKPAPPYVQGFPVGVIVDFDKVGYEPLGIKPGLNCLYLYPDPKGPHGIGATLVPAGPTATACAQAFSRSMTGTELEVFARRMPLDAPDDYPPVARWDWDPSSSTQYIGISCDRKWCEIGPKGKFSPSQTHLYPIPDRKERRVFAVKGWHDEQWLGRNGTAGLYPAPFRGTLVPVKDLGEMNADTFASPHWTEVARVSISPYDPTYETKYHFTPAAMPGKMNRIALCHGALAECLAADPPAPTVPAPQRCPTTSDGKWWARIVNTKGEKYYSCVTQRPHLGIAMPGTARWLWRDDDESIWVECDLGCCQVHRGDEI